MTLTGSYGIGNVEFDLQPTSGRWMPQEPVGVTGDGHPIYPSIHSFEIRWGVMAISEYDQLRDFYKTALLTGTLVVALPDIDADTWTFKNYSGCVLQEPIAGEYFAEHVTDVVMYVLDITL